MKISKIIIVVVLYIGTNFACQPPLPPKPPAIKKAAIFMVSDPTGERLVLPPSWKPTPPMLVHFESKSKKGTKSIYEGVLETNANGGRLVCKITHDSQDDSCRGEVINDSFSRSELYSYGLDIAQAKEYYLDMFKQDPDQKRRLD